MNNYCFLHGIMFGVYYYVIIFKLLNFAIFGKYIVAQ